jgi:hypothetical protein
MTSNWRVDDISHDCEDAEDSSDDAQGSQNLSSDPLKEREEAAVTGKALLFVSFFVMVFDDGKSQYLCVVAYDS